MPLTSLEESNYGSYFSNHIFFHKKNQQKTKKSGLLQKQMAKICFKVFRSMFVIHVLLTNKATMELTAQQTI